MARLKNGSAAGRNRRRVCIITSAHPPFDPRIFHKQAKSLAAAGYDVTLIAQHQYEEVIDGVRLLPLPVPRGRANRMTLTVLRALALALRQRADIYHFHDPELLPAGLLLKLLTGARVIYDAHEDYPRDILTKDWLPRPLRRPIGAAFGAVEGLSVRCLDAVVAATDGIADRFHGIANAVAVRNFPILSLVQRADACPPPSRLTAGHALIYTGSITKIRGVREMVKATGLLAAHHNVRLKLLGRFGDAALEAAVTAMVEAANVDLVGWVPHQEVYAHLAAADVGLALFHPVPNHLEAMPNKLFEYMAAGLPIVASDFPLWHRIVEDEGCGLTVDPQDPQAVAQAVAYLLERPQLRQEMGARGRQAALEKYTWESESQRLVSLYSAL